MKKPRKNSIPVLPTAFYQRDTTTVARELLGQRLVHIVNGERLSGIITETEAYLGIEDRAAHSFGDRRTARTESMYLAGGHAYVYFIYGMHFCFNAVTNKAGVPEAVLVRALVPDEGIETQRRLRGFDKSNGTRVRRDRDLSNGPGKLCQALAINKSQDRVSLTSSGLFVEKTRTQGLAKAEILITPRIGVDYAGPHALHPLRFCLQIGAN